MHKINKANMTNLNFTFKLLPFAIRHKTFLFFLLLISFSPIHGFTQSHADWELEKWPVDLETDFALSALPLHLRADATVYLLDPTKGFYVAHKGTNGFICFVSRMEWEWGVFSKDLAIPVSYDDEGARTIFPVYLDVAAMRATGKFTALQIKDSVITRIKKGIYKAPARTGISYMLAPIMRSYTEDPGNNSIMTMNGPHYMFYAPYLTDADIGGKYPGPFIGNPDDVIFGKGKGPYGYIIVTAGKAAAEKIIADNKDLLKRLADYKPYLKVDTSEMHH